MAENEVAVEDAIGPCQTDVRLDEQDGASLAGKGWTAEVEGVGR